MPNDLDNFSLYVLITSSSALSVSPSDITVNSGGTANYAFMYKLGKPAATSFSTTWYTDASRMTELSGSGPSSPTFVPATPDALQAAVDNPTVFQSGSLQVTAPTLPEGEADDPLVVYYGRMTLHQA